MCFLLIVIHNIFIFTSNKSCDQLKFVLKWNMIHEKLSYLSWFFFDNDPEQTSQNCIYEHFKAQPPKIAHLHQPVTKNDMPPLIWLFQHHQ